MITNLESEFENILISYNRTLQKLKQKNIRIKSGKPVTLKDLRQAINIMNKKHPNCRWKYQNINSNIHYILIEGYYWLIFVYFQQEKTLIDADIEFFINRIKQYEDVLGIDQENLCNKDMYIEELPKYFNKAPGTIKNNIIKMNKVTNNKFIYRENEKNKISKQGIEWLLKNSFKQKYLELLEKYKMELTEKYMKSGYIYDNL